MGQYGFKARNRTFALAQRQLTPPPLLFDDRPIVRRVDPDFSRTILVNTKFDNRVKELRDPESADIYMAGEGLTSGKKVFYISMPLRRNLDQTRFIQEMKETYISDLRNLLEVHFDEQKFVGYAKAKENQIKRLSI